MKGIKRAKKGFSLIEVIISVAVLIILMIPIASVTISTVKSNAHKVGAEAAKRVLNCDPGTETIQIENKC